ncbi:MAG: CRISPR-associated endonuclease Cas2 [Thiotrichaceae bacterium]|nr:CRISPR-associated endonuclease Cas2 [Thiotrichaceae bacterium]PCI13438.1 MAG: CRISPR-associated endonuclease Cas2 [Thiotrichales bacterium]
MRLSRLWIIAYDIEDDRIRRRIYQLLKNHGEAVQYSVFECWLLAHQLLLLRRQVQQEVGVDDSVRWYPLCVWCRRDIESQGVGRESDDPPFILL